MTNDTTLAIVEALYPDFNDYADNARFDYWMDYACELDILMSAAYTETIVDYLNSRLLKLRASSPEHDACVDVASNLEESQPTIYKGVFKYE